MTQFFSRTAWGARAPRPGITRRNTDQITAYVVHYADLVARETLEDEKRAVQAIQRYHMDSNRWNDIGYHHIIGMTGNVYEGRPITQVGSHCAGFNTPSIGVCFLTKDGITLNAAKSFIDLVKITNFVTLHRMPDIFDHREKVATHCPGDRITEWVKRLRAPGGELAK